MADALYDLLQPHLRGEGKNQKLSQSQDASNKYLARLLSLRLSDLTTTEPQSLYQASHSNLVSIQALSSRSHRTTTTSLDHLATLHGSLPALVSLTGSIREAVPPLDESALRFASSYSRSKEDNSTLNSRKDSMLLAQQADKLQDILELPALLSAAIASSRVGSTGGANYSQALDLFAHIKRLQILYPESQLTKSTLALAETAMKDMTTNLISNLRSQNIRLAAAIRTIGWLRRVAPELSSNTISVTQKAPTNLTEPTTVQDEGHFGTLFLSARLCTFLTMTEALAPLRDLADQETTRRTEYSTPTSRSNSIPKPGASRRQSNTTAYSIQGQQTERYLKRYIEIFREQSFATISMYRNIFPADGLKDATDDDNNDLLAKLRLPYALSTFPLHLVEIFIETLRTYLPNISDPAARESLLMQVLYAANSLGRLGADFSMMIALLDSGYDVDENGEIEKDADVEEKENKVPQESEWARVMRKHRIQAARLEAMAAGQEEVVTRRGSNDVVAQ